MSRWPFSPSRQRSWTSTKDQSELRRPKFDVGVTEERRQPKESNATQSPAGVKQILPVLGRVEPMINDMSGAALFILTIAEVFADARGRVALAEIDLLEGMIKRLATRGVRELLTARIGINLEPSGAIEKMGPGNRLKPPVTAGPVDQTAHRTQLICVREILIVGVRADRGGGQVRGPRVIQRRRALDEQDD